MSGRNRSGSIPAAKPIPGTTLTLPPNPALPGSAHSARSQSLSGPSCPPLPQAGEVPDGDAYDGSVAAAAAAEEGNPGKVKFFLEEASSVGSRTSTESGFSEHRTTTITTTTSSSNTGSYAEACKKAAAAGPATAAGDAGRPGSRGGGQVQSSGRSAELGGAKSTGRGEDRWSRDREFVRRDQRQDGRYRGRGQYHQSGRGRGGDFGSRRENSDNRGGNYDSRGRNYGEGRGLGRRGGYYHHDQQYSRQSSRQSRSEPQFSGQELNDNRNLRRAVSDRPPDTGDR